MPSHGTQGIKKKSNKNNISQTCTICLWVCCWHNLRQSIHCFWNRATTQLHRPYRTWILQQQWPWLIPSGRPPARHVSSITPSHQFHTALTFDKQNCNSLLMYVGCSSFFSVLKEKRNVWNFVEIQRCPFFALQTLTSLLYFFLLEKSSWLLYIVMTLMMTMITYLLAVQGALLPACVCMKGAMTVWPNGGGCDEDNNDIRSVCVIATILNVSFLSMRDSWEIFVCACARVRMDAYTFVCLTIWKLW